MAFCHLKYRGFERSSLIWKLYLQMDMLYPEIDGEIFFLHDLHEFVFT
jgi:hypothetical protein